MNTLYSRRSATPWPIRALLIASILFGICVDLSSSPTVAATQAPLFGLLDGNSTAANLVRALASRHG